jgi:hypothetical protein
MAIEPGDLAGLRLGACPNCAAHDWRPSDHLVALLVPPERTGETEVRAPLVAVRCGSCGFVALFSPDAIGVRLTSTPWEGSEKQ